MLAEPVSPNGLGAGVVKAAYRNGVPDGEIIGHTRHRSLTRAMSSGSDATGAARH